jgi:hypothetical protein
MLGNSTSNPQQQLNTLFAYAEIWLMLMLMLKCCERKTPLKSSSSIKEISAALSALLAPHYLQQ